MKKLEQLVGKDKVSIQQCQRLAEDLGHDKMTFDLVGPKGRIRCKWLDAYFGMFQQVGKDEGKFMMASELEFMDGIHCENLAVSD